MCKIRTIVLNDKKEITSDFMVEVKGIEINIIDRPAFCIFSPRNSNAYNTILFKFSNLEEEVMTDFSSDSSMSISIGCQSGCVYSCQYRDGATFDQLHELQIKFLGNNSTVRYQNNVRNFIKLIEEIKTEVGGKQAAETLRQK